MKSLIDGYPHIEAFVSRLIVEKYRIDVNDIPRYEDRADDHTYVAKLSRDILAYGIDEVHTADSLIPELEVKSELFEGFASPKEASTATPIEASQLNQDEVKLLLVRSQPVLNGFPIRVADEYQGDITQESLTTMIRNDEITPIRSRRRIHYTYNTTEASGKYRYPHGN